MSEDQISHERFKVMESKLYFGIMTPGMLLTLGFGGWMLSDYAWQIYSGALWLHLKFGLLALLVVYHFVCGKWLYDFKHDKNQRSHVFYRWMNEIPVLFLCAIIFLAELKPF
jgi:putative membrane protein